MARMIQCAKLNKEAEGLERPTHLSEYFSGSVADVGWPSDHAY